MEWWNSCYTIMTILGVLCLFYLIGKKQYEKNPDFYIYNDCYKSDKNRKNWKTWKHNKIPSIHSRMTNSVHRC